MKKPYIYAVDFDGTLCEYQWPGIGAPNLELITALVRTREIGNKVILWSCREGDELAEAVEWCKKHGLEFDAVNSNIPEIVEAFKGDSRKIFANEYIDDRMSTKFGHCVPYVTM